MRITNEQLIEKARSLVKPRTIRNGFTVGEVGCALVSEKGNVYVGTNIDASSGMGFCDCRHDYSGRGENREDRRSLKKRRTNAALREM